MYPNVSAGGGGSCVATLIMTLYVAINIHTDIYLYSRLIVMLASYN